MSLAAGELTYGMSGATAIKSVETGGTLHYIPKSNFSRDIVIGTSIVPLVNNTASPVNTLKGPASAIFRLNAPFIADVYDADFYARAILSCFQDGDAHNYHTLTNWDDNYSGDLPEVFGLCKFGNWSGGIDFAANGGASAIGQSFSGMSADPLSLAASGGVPALTAPSTGALSGGNLLSSCQATITGASGVVAVRWSFNTNVTMSPVKCSPSSNPLFTSHIFGLIQQGLTGSVTITQRARATTFLSRDGSDATLSIALGSTGAGIGITVNVIGVGISKQSNLGLNLTDTTYQLKSATGNSLAVAIVDL